MNRIVDSSLTVLDIAGAASPIPYVGAVSIIVRSIVETSRQIAINKRKCDQLARRCNLLLETLQDQESAMEGTRLLEVADQIRNTLEKVNGRIKRWSKHNRVKTFLIRQEIDDGLQKCISEVDDSMGLFHMNSSIMLHESNRQNFEMTRRDTAEMRELLHQILTNTMDMGRVVDMQRSGEHAAEPIMQAGQNELQRLRHEMELTQANSQPDTSERDSPVIAEPLQLNPSHDSQRYLEYQRGLLTLHRETGIPPTVKRLDGEVRRLGDIPIAGGTYSDVWLGTWLGEQKVALKALRGVKTSATAKQRFEHEIHVWAELEHDHILPFFGIVTDLGQHIHMVSPWQENGNVLEYVKRHEDVDRIHLLAGAAKGIEYLHKRNVIHGNVKCANILVSAKEEACICDFGMSKIIEEVTEVSASATLTAGGSARWLAPELIEGSVTSPTMASDTYSFAMAMLECLSLLMPYHNRKRDAAVIHAVVVLKLQPPRPQCEAAERWLSDDLWHIMQGCWAPDPASRPSMGQVAERLQEVKERRLGRDGHIVGWAHPMDQSV